KTEIVLLITPRLLRTMQRADSRTVEFAAGTEASSSGGPLGGASAPSFIPPQPAQPPVPAYVPSNPVPTQGGTLVPFGGMQPAQERNRDEPGLHAYRIGDHRRDRRAARLGRAAGQRARGPAHQGAGPAPHPPPDPRGDRRIQAGIGRGPRQEIGGRLGLS